MEFFLSTKIKFLDRLPENQPVGKEIIGDSFLKQLEQKRSEYLTSAGNTKKEKENAGLHLGRV